VDNPNIKINRECTLRSLAYAEINLQTSKFSKAAALQAEAIHQTPCGRSP